ncbi:GAF domain-like [Phytophthora cactorum]|nr:GAF domain-like [Phytophthora cactorum]
MQSVRLHLDKRVESSTPFSATTTSEPSAWNNGEPPAPPLSLSIALRGLMAGAEALHDGVDFANFVNIAGSPQLPFFRNDQTQWKRVERSTVFTLLKRDDEVLAQARLDASIEEVASVLGATTDQLHAATMEGLYDDAFIAGSVAYVERPHENDQEFKQLAVKTSNFVHSKILGKNEQWCFGETLRSKPEGDSFTITQSSLEADQSQSLPARLALKDTKRRVAQLRDVSTAYLVERTTDTQRLRITFHALYKPEGTPTKDGPVVTRRAARARLLRLARGTSELSQVVRRRRFGVQVFADHSAFHIRNPRCTCCTRKFTPIINLIPRTRCYLCGYYVCVSCSSSEKMETYNGRVATIMRRRLNFDHMLSVRPGPERVLGDEASTPQSARTFDTSSTATSEFSGRVCDSDQVTLGQRRAAFLVLEQLLLIDQKEAQVQADKNAELLSAASERQQPTEAAKRAMDVSKCRKDLDACKFASADSRPYPMMPALIQNEEANEDERLAAIEHFRLHDVANVPELNVICSLAAAEMKAPHSVITLVERDVVTLLATNAPEYWDVGTGNPREQTFCQHFVMDDKPLLVRHAEADMRFYHIAPVTMRSLRFYAGFPVSVPCVSKTPGQPERVVIGALCCLDEKPHEMTRSQYWRLMKLADAASNILERTAKEYIADPENHPLGQNCIRGQTFAEGKGAAMVTC